LSSWGEGKRKEGSKRDIGKEPYVSSEVSERGQNGGKTSEEKTEESLPHAMKGKGKKSSSVRSRGGTWEMVKQIVAPLTEELLQR